MTVDGRLQRNWILWVDGSGGVLVGVVMLALAAPLSGLYGLPMGLMRVMGVANLTYAAYSLTLARRPRRPAWSIHLLVAANLAWAVLCLVLATHFAGSATAIGLAHLIAEALYVGGLAVLEWKWRRLLVFS